MRPPVGDCGHVGTSSPSPPPRQRTPPSGQSTRVASEVGLVSFSRTTAAPGGRSYRPIEPVGWPARDELRPTQNTTAYRRTTRPSTAVATAGPTVASVAHQTSGDGIGSAVSWGDLRRGDRVDRRREDRLSAPPRWAGFSGSGRRLRKFRPVWRQRALAITYSRRLPGRRPWPGRVAPLLSG
jgi:hypothetical protein